MRSTYLAIVLIRSRIWAFDWCQYRWPWMTLNGEMALILRYFTKFGSFRGALHKSDWQSHNYGRFTITVSCSKHLQRDHATATVFPSTFINSRLNAQYLPSCRFAKKSYIRYMSFRLVPISVTLNNIERRNGPYFALFYRIR